MEEKTAGSNKGYQKQIKKEEAQPKPKKNVTPDYSSPLAKKWPALIEAIEKGDAGAVQKLIEEGLNVNLARSGVTPLMVAASKGQEEIARVIIEAGVNINEKNDDGWNALHKAAHDQPGTGIVELLLESGIDSEAKDRSGKTALMLAEERKHGDIVREIKKHQGQLQTDAKEWTAFLHTAEGKPFRLKGQLDTLTSYTPLWWLPLAALGGAGLVAGFFLGMVRSVVAGAVAGLLVVAGYYLRMTMLQKYLEKVGPLPELDIHLLRQKRRAGEPIMAPGTHRMQEAADEASQASPDPSESFSPSETGVLLTASVEDTELRAPSGLFRKVDLKSVVFAGLAIVLIALLAFAAVKKESLAKWYFTKKLQHRGIPLTGQAFLDAVSKNDGEALELFIKAGIAGDATNDKGQTGLIIAAEQGHAEHLRQLVRLTPALLDQPDASGMTPLMTAAYNGHEKFVQSLVESGADVNHIVQGQEGAASALQAVLDVPDFQEEHLRIMQYLLQKGADVKGRNAAGRFPLQFAAAHDRLEAAMELREKGADVNDADLRGETALRVAACSGYTDFITFLIDQGANVKTATADGQTPLMCAAHEGHVDSITALIDRGADINAKAAQGSTALTEASLAGNGEIVKLLLEKGADPGSGYVPESYRTLKGNVVAINVKKRVMRDVLNRIADAAARDGYTIKYDPALNQKTTMAVKAPWNVVLNKLANKDHLFLLIKEKEVLIVPFHPPVIR